MTSTEHDRRVADEMGIPADDLHLLPLAVALTAVVALTPTVADNEAALTRATMTLALHRDALLIALRDARVFWAAHEESVRTFPLGDDE